MHSIVVMGNVGNGLCSLHSYGDGTYRAYSNVSVDSFLELYCDTLAHHFGAIINSTKCNYWRDKYSRTCVFANVYLI